ncbi:hypothetical protein [Paraburkholderia sp. BL23I1N1]|uniref:hypothetical protein n=1 Tax=Paraburkholderia sp. BL23I1N1 TaxID=1938802 RepID=UPI00217DD6FA|nr:hypothetical protein [Paraburkholderia sp. BL23I1N1]
MLALVVLVAIVAGTSAYVLVAHERQRRLTELEERATRIADLFSRSLAQPLWNIDVGAINGQLAALAPNPEVAQFTVTAVGYGTVSTVGSTVQPSPGDSVVRVRAIEYTPPGDAPKEKIGEVRVVLTRAVAEQGDQRRPPGDSRHDHGRRCGALRRDFPVAQANGAQPDQPSRGDGRPDRERRPSRALCR